MVVEFQNNQLSVESQGKERDGGHIARTRKLMPIIAVFLVYCNLVCNKIIKSFINLKFKKTYLQKE